MGSEWGYVIPIILLFVIIWVQRRREAATVYRIIKRRKDQKGDREQMKELAKRFLEKECIVYTFYSQLDGVIIKEISDGAILVEKNGTLEAVNFDFITRIREYPRKKNGKKKSIILD